MQSQPTRANDIGQHLSAPNNLRSQFRSTVLDSHEYRAAEFREFGEPQLMSRIGDGVRLNILTIRWCEQRHIDLMRIAPANVGRYLDSLDLSPATKKLHLAALRHFFDQLVTRHIVILNPAASVRGERLQVVEGKTPEITVQQARRLLRNIDVSHVVGLRDRAIIAILIYTAARVGAVAKL